MNWDDIKTKVEENGNVWTTTMDVLRDAANFGKLGVHVRKHIAASLAGMGLAHIPQELPSYQTEQVRLYKRGTPVGDMLDKVLAPGELNDDAIVKMLGDGGPDYASIVLQIKELVSD